MEQLRDRELVYAGPGYAQVRLGHGLRHPLPSSFHRKTVDLWKLPVNFTVKYDIEFAAQNRSTGNELWLTGGFRF